MSAATVRGWERARASHTARAPLSRASTVAAPRVWLYTRLLDFSHLPSAWSRLLAFLYYRVCRQPPALRDEDGSLKFRDIRGAHGSRRQARERCESPDDVVVGIVYGHDYGPHVAEEDTFCRPLHPRYVGRDARDSLLYTQDLECRPTDAQIQSVTEVLKAAHLRAKG